MRRGSLESQKLSGRRRLKLERLEPRNMLCGAEICISEFMAANTDTLYDFEGDSSDWIEIRNSSAATVDLAGWYLTDDEGDLTQWQFPDEAASELASGEYLVLFASDKSSDPGIPTDELHTNFKLGKSGEYLALVMPNGTTIAHEYSPKFPVQLDNISYGSAEISYGSAEAYFTIPTPGSMNLSGSLGVVKEPHISVDRGFFQEPFQVEISTDTPGAEIRYTTDGSAPTAATGSPYSNSITISSTTTLRAAAFKPGFLASDIDTQTYLFLDNVLLQSESFGSNGNGLPDFPDWGHAGNSGDWEVDPEIVGHSDLYNRLSTSDLRAIPTISLVMNWDDMFEDNGQGIYIQGEGRERAVSVEQILPDGSSGFHIDAAVIVFGGSSVTRWKTDKLSLRLKFKEEFGPTKLEEPVFGPEATDSFDTIVLDAVFNFSWTIGWKKHTDRARFIQDQHVANLHQDMGGFSPHAKYHHLYINGLYWGMYYVHERPDGSFAAAYLGGDKDDYDIIKHWQGNVVSGTRVAYDSLVALSQLDLSNDSNYRSITDVLDIDNFIDYMLVNFYAGNVDWGKNNWYASKNRVDPNGKWRFHSWDAEYAHCYTDPFPCNPNFDNTVYDHLGGPTGIHQDLLANDEYRLLFADHVQRNFFHDGTLTPENTAAEYRKLMDEIDRAIVGESARWGDNREVGDNPYTRDSWLSIQNNLLNNYFPLRTDIVLDQLRNNLLPSAAADAPDFLINGNPRHGGEIQAGDFLTFSGLAGTVYYTLDGTDPRLEGGTVSPTAIAATIPVPIDQSAQLRARLLTPGLEWSALQESYFSVEAFPTPQQLAITEIHYNPAEEEGEYTSNDFEFLELTNKSATPINLTGMRFTAGIEYEYPANTTSILAPGDRLLLVNNLTAFELRYGSGLNVVGEFSGNLNNGGEQLRLRSSQGDILLDFTYGDEGQWPELADGLGASLEIVDPLGNYSDGQNWRPSSEYHGSPGVAGSEPLADVILNEVLSHSHEANVDLIELHNLSASPIDVGGWAISDQNNNLLRGSLPAGSIIAAGGYAVFDESQIGFGLDADTGEQLWLMETDDTTGDLLRFADVVKFESAETEVSLGRWSNGDPDAPLVSMINQTFGSPNSGPLTDTIRITEIFYNAAWFNESFSDGVSSGFDPMQGNFSVVDGTYVGLPSATDPLAVLDQVISLPNVFKIEAGISVPEATVFDRNAAILFDYQSNTDFKFARLDANTGRWQLGQRTGGTWDVLAEVAEKLVPGQEYDMAVEIHATEARLVVAGVEKIRLDYFSNLSDGNIGISSDNGEFVLTRFQVDPIDDAEFEFVELYNTTGTTIHISGWELDSAVDFTFPPGTTIGAGQTLVVVGFDPADSGAIAAFQVRFGIDGSVDLVGGYQGRLDNSLENLQLMRPLEPESEDADVVVDEVPYTDQSPWPTAADQGARSLYLHSIAGFGSFAASWRAGLPTPGILDTTFPQPGDSNGDGDVDSGDLTAWQGGYGTSTGATASIGNFDSDEAVTGFDFLVWQRNFGATQALGSSSDTSGQSEVINGGTFDSNDLEAWDSQYDTIPARLAAGAGLLKSQTATQTTKPLSADLVNAVMVTDLTLSLNSQSSRGAASPVGKEPFDWVSHSAKWLQHPVVRYSSSEIASKGAQAPSSSLNNRGADDSLNEELLDELFAEVSLELLL